MSLSSRASTTSKKNTSCHWGFLNRYCRRYSKRRKKKRTERNMGSPAKSLTYLPCHLPRDNCALCHAGYAREFGSTPFFVKVDYTLGLMNGLVRSLNFPSRNTDKHFLVNERHFYSFWPVQMPECTPMQSITDNTWLNGRQCYSKLWQQYCFGM